MIPGTRSRTNLGIIAGLLFKSYAGYLAAKFHSAGDPRVALIAAAGVFFFVYGCINYAWGKGYGTLRGMLGFLSLVGLVILIALPDRHKTLKSRPVAD